MTMLAPTGSVFATTVWTLVSGSKYPMRAAPLVRSTYQICRVAGSTAIAATIVPLEASGICVKSPEIVPPTGSTVRRPASVAPPVAPRDA
jgi:hypothetical protein